MSGHDPSSDDGAGRATSLAEFALVVRRLSLSLADLEMSEAFREEVKKRADLSAMSEPGEVKFDHGDNLV